MSFILAKNEYRVGKIYISDEMLRDYGSRIFGDMGFIPTRAEFMYLENRFEYIGVSPYFDPLNVGEVSPTYEIIITRNEDGTESYRFERR